MDADQSAALSYTTDSTTATITTKQAGLQLQLPDARAAESQKKSNPIVSHKMFPVIVAVLSVATTDSREKINSNSNRSNTNGNGKPPLDRRRVQSWRDLKGLSWLVYV